MPKEATNNEVILCIESLNEAVVDNSQHVIEAIERTNALLEKILEALVNGR